MFRSQRVEELLARIAEMNRNINAYSVQAVDLTRKNNALRDEVRGLKAELTEWRQGTRYVFDLPSSPAQTTEIARLKCKVNRSFDEKKRLQDERDKALKSRDGYRMSLAVTRLELGQVRAALRRAEMEPYLVPRVRPSVSVAAYAELANDLAKTRVSLKKAQEERDHATSLLEQSDEIDKMQLDLDKVNRAYDRVTAVAVALRRERDDLKALPRTSNSLELAGVRVQLYAAREERDRLGQKSNSQQELIQSQATLIADGTERDVRLRSRLVEVNQTVKKLVDKMANPTVFESQESLKRVFLRNNMVIPKDQITSISGDTDAPWGCTITYKAERVEEPRPDSVDAVWRTFYQQGNPTSTRKADALFTAVAEKIGEPDGAAVVTTLIHETPDERTYNIKITFGGDDDEA